jgi:hypothetical protein
MIDHKQGSLPTGSRYGLGKTRFGGFFFVCRKRVPVAAAEGCVRLRSSRRPYTHDVPERPQHFATAAQPDAAFGSCYKGRLSGAEWSMAYT